MYSVNNSCNLALELVETVSFLGDAETKRNTIKAWGYAYSRIGSTYHAGLINNTPNKTNGNYVTRQAFIDEANANFDQAAQILSGLTASVDYLSVMGKIIPSVYFMKTKCQFP